MSTAIDLEDPQIRLAIKAAGIKVKGGFSEAHENREDQETVYLSYSYLSDGWWSMPSATMDVLKEIFDCADLDGWYPEDFLPEGGDCELLSLATEITEAGAILAPLDDDDDDDEAYTTAPDPVAVAHYQDQLSQMIISAAQIDATIMDQLDGAFPTLAEAYTWTKNALGLKPGSTGFVETLQTVYASMRDSDSPGLNTERGPGI